MAVLLVAPWSGARAETRYVVSRDYQYGGSSAGDSSEWRPVTWVWRSASGRAACLESVLTDPAARRDPLETPACRRARLAPVRHRSTVDVLAANPECGPLTTVAFAPPDRDRLARVTGCIPSAELAARPGPFRPGSWVFVVDVRRLAEVSTARLHRIGTYPSWTDCEQIRMTVHDDLMNETDAEAAEAAALAGSGVCLPEELLD